MYALPENELVTGEEGMREKITVAMAMPARRKTSRCSRTRQRMSCRSGRLGGVENIFFCLPRVNFLFAGTIYR